MAMVSVRKSLWTFVHNSLHTVVRASDRGQTSSLDSSFGSSQAVSLTAELRTPLSPSRWWPLRHPAYIWHAVMATIRWKNQRLLDLAICELRRLQLLRFHCVIPAFVSTHTTTNHLHYLKMYVFLPLTRPSVPLFLYRISQGVWSRYYVEVNFVFVSFTNPLGGRDGQVTVIIRRSGLRRYERRPSNSSSRWRKVSKKNHFLEASMEPFASSTSSQQL